MLVHTVKALGSAPISSSDGHIGSSSSNSSSSSRSNSMASVVHDIGVGVCLERVQDSVH